MVKLKYRWQDSIFNFQERMKVLKQIQSEQRNNAKQRALAARTSLINRSDKFSLLVRSMRGKVGHLSSIAISKGKKNFISHYNAKKRVYVRRKTARQLARTVMLEKWKSRYYASKEHRWGWIRGNSIITSKDIGGTTWKGVTLTEPSDPSWFDEEGYPLTSRDPETGRFVNPWSSESSNGKNGLKKLFRWKVIGAFNRLMDAVGLFGGNVVDTSERAHSQLDQSVHRGHAISRIGSGGGIDLTIPFNDRDQEAIRLTWVGHSTTVVSFPGGFNILTDPHFSNYAGPVRRATPPAIGVADLPDVVDCVLISHDHMDHLDYWSILELVDSNKVIFWIVPLGIKSWLVEKAGVSPENIVELEWWEEVHLSKLVGRKVLNTEKRVPVVDKIVRASRKDTIEEETSIDLAEKNQLMITCAPAQHWCSRNPFDRNKRLWCSFSVRATPAPSHKPGARTHSFYFAGDTGLPHEFPLHHQIGDRIGPFDLSAIPIGAYEPNWFMRDAHCNPAEAVKIHQAIRSRKSVAIHFDTFNLSDEPMGEPPNVLSAEVRKTNEVIAAQLARNANLPTADETMIAMLPPLVDFVVIKQGQSIESLPNEVNSEVGSTETSTTTEGIYDHFL